MADRIDESIKQFLYRDFSGGLNSLPPGVRIADTQYARGSQDLRRDRGILETRGLWTVINNQGSLLTRSPVYGAKVWDGGRGVPILTVLANKHDAGGYKGAALSITSIMPDDINLSSRILSGWSFADDIGGKTLLPYNFAEYGKYLIISCPFNPHYDVSIFPGAPRLLQLYDDTPSLIESSSISMWGLFNIVTVWNHRVYIADDQINGNHLFYSGPGKALPIDVDRGDQDEGFFVFGTLGRWYYYDKDRDWFHESNGGGWINFPEETGRVTAFIKGNSYLYVFTEEAIYGVARDNSVRLLASVGTLSQQTVTMTPWGIIFLGKDRRLYAWGGTGEPKIIDWPIKDVLDEAYIDTPLWVARKKWTREEDFDTGNFTNTKYTEGGIRLEDASLIGSWESGELTVKDAIRLLAVHPVYEFTNMDTPAAGHIQYMNIGWKTYASAGSPPDDWKKVGSFGDRWFNAHPLGIRGISEEDTVGFGYFDYYPRIFGVFLNEWITLGGLTWDSDRDLDIPYNDAGADAGLPIPQPYSKILIGFQKQDAGDTGPVLKGLSANILCGDAKKVAAAPNLFYYAGKLHLNLAVDSVNDDRPICDTCLVFDGKGWDIHKKHYALHELEWQGRRIFLGSEWKQLPASDPIGTNRWLWYETDRLSPQPTIEKPYLPEGKLYTKAFDFGKPGVIKTIHNIMIRFKQEAEGIIRVYLLREWKGYTVVTQATPDIEINSTGSYKTEVLSVPVDKDGVGVAQGTLFQIRIVGITGGENGERAQFRVDSIKCDVSFGEAKETRGMIPIGGNGVGQIT